MPDLSQFQHFYLMGIKGVAMASLAQILLDAGKSVVGCDVAKEFVTQEILDDLDLKIETGFTHNLPENTQVVIYTSAHGGPQNPIVQQAKEKNLPTLSQAEALAYFFNQKQGIAVCGVGGKSTVTAMITWILHRLRLLPSYSVGVGKIIGLEKTGAWEASGQYFVAEADEYVIDTAAISRGEAITPRFSFLKPKISVCTNLEYDHPDVYQSLEHTLTIFGEFLHSTQANGSLIYNHTSPALVELIKTHQDQFKQKPLNLLSFGLHAQADAYLKQSRIENQTNIGDVEILGQYYQLQLAIPGEFNLLNALAAILAVNNLGVEVSQAIKALSSFKSTKRRFEFIGEQEGVLYYDDYAHHPHEIKKTIEAFKAWHPNPRKVVAFQPHTYSRTKELLPDFVDALSLAKEVVLLDIFPSARETFDPEVSSDLLVEKIQQQYPLTKIQNLKTIDSLADYCQTQLQDGDILLTMGAGDIYQVYEQIGLA
jgi:UDP-N-acetylmuramate--alanine ligase